MRRLLLTLLMVALLALFGIIVISGFTIGGVPIGYSIQEIIDTNDELDTAIATLSTEISTEYQGAKTNLDSSFRRLQTQKQAYQETIAYSSAEELAEANQTKEYKLDYLWTNIGLYATRNNLILKADLSYGSSGVQNQYNISITAVGQYLDISEFVYAIEKDPNLGFRIEEFALVPYSEDTLQATFILKNISIDANSINASNTSGVGTVTNNENEAGNTDSTNTTITNNITSGNTTND